VTRRSNIGKLKASGSSTMKHKRMVSVIMAEPEKSGEDKASGGAAAPDRATGTAPGTATGTAPEGGKNYSNMLAESGMCGTGWLIKAFINIYK